MYLKLVTSTKRDKGLMLFRWTLLLKKEVRTEQGAKATNMSSYYFGKSIYVVIISVGQMVSSARWSWHEHGKVI